MNRDDIIKAVVLASHRSGSVFLTTCLDSHPNVKCYSELLVDGFHRFSISAPGLLRHSPLINKLWGYAASGAWNPVGLMNELYSRKDARVMAFKAMYNHLADPRTRRYFRLHPEVRVIHLKRDNLLKQYVSKMIEVHHGRWWREPPPLDKKQPIEPIPLDPKHAIAEMRQLTRQSNRYERLFAQHSRITLTYETMIDGPALSHDAASAITDLLEIESAPMTCNYVKTNPDDLKLLISNYDEIADALQGTPFSRFLD